MPQIKVNGVTINYEAYGAGDETIVFSHGYLMNHRMFDDQINMLKDRYRIIAYDHRCHGGSEVYTQPFGMYDLMEDGAAVVDKLVGGPVHWMGMSTGGYVGLRLMIRRPDLIKSMVLMDTGAHKESAESLKAYNQMLLAVRLFGIRPIHKRALTILMGEKFRTDPSRKAQLEEWTRSILSLNYKAIYRFGKAIFGRDSVLDKLAAIDTPTLILVGDKDVATPPHHSEDMLAQFPNAHLTLIADAGHSAPVEEPDAVNAAIEAFLARL